MDQIIECVPNFSAGRDPDTVEKIVDAFRGSQQVKLLDYQQDADHNRSVVTVVGQPDALKKAVIQAVGTAIERIDMRTHQGQHPRMGAVDVVPFIPVKNLTMDEAVAFSRQVADAYGWHPRIPHTNAGGETSSPSPDALARVEALCAADLSLYQSIRSRGTVR